MFTENEKESLNSRWKHKRSKIVKQFQTMEQKQSKTKRTKTKTDGSITILDFKLKHLVVEINRAWQWPPNKHTGWWEKTDDPQISPQSYSHLILKEVSSSHCRKQMVPVILDRCRWMNEIRSLSLTLHKTQLPMIQIMQHKA